MLVSNSQQRGFTLLFSIIISSIMLAVGLAVLSITLDQIKLAGISRSSELAFYAANAGVECLRLYDASVIHGDTFDVPSATEVAPGNRRAGVQISCLDQLLADQGGTAASGESQWFEATWLYDDGSVSGSQVCSNFSIWKFYESSATDSDGLGPWMGVVGQSRYCPLDAECTVIKARGYNRACNQLTNPGTVVERELTYVY